MKKKKLLVVVPEYSVKVRFGTEKLESCIAQMVEAKRRNVRECICNSQANSL